MIPIEKKKKREKNEGKIENTQFATVANQITHTFILSYIQI